MQMKRLYSCNTSFLDLLFNMLLAFTALFVLAFAMMNVVKEDKKSLVEVKAEFMITMTWNDDMDDDLDLYVEDPNGALACFRRREDGLMHLDRDDLGHRSDFVQTPNGEIRYPHNREIVTLRSIEPGEYCVNAHAYRKLDARPSKVVVTVEKLNPTVKMVIRNEVTLEKSGDEKTVVRFTLNKNGDMISNNTLQKSLTQALKNKGF